MRVVPAVPEAKVLDAYQRIMNPADFVADGVAARGGYLDHVTVQELELQLAAGLALWFFGYAKQFDGAHLAQRAKDLGAPLGATIGFDVEAIDFAPGDAGTAAAKSLITKLNVCTAQIQNPGYLAMGYFGALQPLTSDEMSGLLVARYSRAGSKIRDRFGHIAAPERGWCHLQYAPQHVVHGVMIDDGRAKVDYRGDCMTWVVA